MNENVFRFLPKWKYYSCFFLLSLTLNGINSVLLVIYSAKKTVVRLMSAQKLALNRMQKLCSIMHIYYSNWPHQNKKSICADMWECVYVCACRDHFFSLLLFFPCFAFSLKRLLNTHIFVFFAFVTLISLLIGCVSRMRARDMTIMLWFFVRDVLKYFSCFTRIWRSFFFFFLLLFLSSFAYFIPQFALFAFFFSVAAFCGHAQNRTHYW